MMGMTARTLQLNECVQAQPVQISGTGRGWKNTIAPAQNEHWVVDAKWDLQKNKCLVGSKNTHTHTNPDKV